MWYLRQAGSGGLTRGGPVIAVARVMRRHRGLGLGIPGEQQVQRSCAEAWYALAGLLEPVWLEQGGERQQRGGRQDL